MAYPSELVVVKVWELKMSEQANFRWYRLNMKVKLGIDQGNDNPQLLFVTLTYSCEQVIVQKEPLECSRLSQFRWNTASDGVVQSRKDKQIGQQPKLCWQGL